MEYKDYEDYWEKWGMFRDPESAAKRMHIWTELDGLGQLLREGLIDLDFIPSIIHAVVIYQWEKWGQLFIERRERRTGEEELSLNFEYLYNEVMKYRNQNMELAT